MYAANRALLTSLVIAVAMMVLASMNGCDESSSGLRPLSDGSDDIALPAPLPGPAPEIDPMEALAGGNRAFALAFWDQFRGSPGNTVFSPLSIRTAVAMAYAGAVGATHTQMAEVMRFNPDTMELLESYRELQVDLEQRNQPGTEQADPVELQVANALWAQEGYPLRGEYVTSIRQGFGSHVEWLDFRRVPEACRDRINAWVAERTHNRILNILPPGSITSATRTTLANAIYFKGPWQNPFPQSATAQGSFWNRNGSEQSAQLMHQQGTFPYTEADGFQALEMPYRTGQLAMVVLLPRAERLAEFEHRLDETLLAQIWMDLEPQTVEVTLPKFSFQSYMVLKEWFVSNGMDLAFDLCAADFSNMVDLTRTADPGFCLSQIYHKVRIDVDEVGSEAAAATVIIGVGSPPTPEPAPEIRVFRADHPFWFLIRDRATGIILFYGRFADVNTGPADGGLPLGA